MFPNHPPPGPHPGWYPDPTRRYEVRYFNGVTWTADVATGGQRMVDSMNAAPFPKSAPGWTDAWAPGPKPLPATMATIALVLALVGIGIGWIPFLFAVGAVAAVAGAVFGFLALKRIKAGTERGRHLALWAIGLLPVAAGVVFLGAWMTTKAVKEFDDYNNAPANHLVVGPCQADGDQITFSGSLQNLSKKSSDFTVNVSLESASGRRVTRSLHLDEVAADETRPWELSTELLGG